MHETQRNRIAALLLLVTACYSGRDDDSTLRSGEAEMAFPFDEPDGYGAGWFGVETAVRKIGYASTRGYAVAEGDILLGRIDELSAMERGEAEPPRSAVKPDMLWAGGVIPYAFDGSLSAEGLAAAQAAIDHWNTHTNVRLTPHAGEADVVVFQGGDGCSSYVGRIGGAQPIMLGEGCYAGQAIHEIGHAAGLWHEQSRADRDSHVQVLLENVIPGHEGNFATYVAQGFAGADVGGYDDGSIMHYGSFFFSVDGEPTITRLDGSLIDPQREALTPGDLGGIAALYGQPGGGGGGEGGGGEGGGGEGGGGEGGEGGGGGGGGLQPPSGCGAMVADQLLGPGDMLGSCDGRFTLVMQTDGNAALYHNGIGALWGSGSEGQGGKWLVMQSDGNLVIYGDAGAVWSTSTHGHPGAVLALQDDGNLVVYDGGVALWNSQTCCH
jgi:hypothetical protein